MPWTSTNVEPKFEFNFQNLFKMFRIRLFSLSRVSKNKWTRPVHNKYWKNFLLLCSQLTSHFLVQIYFTILFGRNIRTIPIFPWFSIIHFYLMKILIGSYPINEKLNIMPIEQLNDGFLFDSSTLDDFRQVIFFFFDVSTSKEGNLRRTQLRSVDMISIILTQC